VSKVGEIVRKSLVTHIKKGIENRTSTFLLSFTRVSGPQMNTLRKTLKTMGAEFHVSRNRMAQRALRDLNLENLAQNIQGQMAFVWSDADALEVSKALVKFVKEYEGMAIGPGFLQGAVLEKKDIERMSDLPSKKVLMAALLGTLQLPLVRLAGALNGKTRELLFLLKTLSEKK